MKRGKLGWQGIRRWLKDLEEWRTDKIRHGRSEEADLHVAPKGALYSNFTCSVGVPSPSQVHSGISESGSRSHLPCKVRYLYTVWWREPFLSHEVWVFALLAVFVAHCGRLGLGER